MSRAVRIFLIILAAGSVMYVYRHAARDSQNPYFSKDRDARGGGRNDPPVGFRPREPIR